MIVDKSGPHWADQCACGLMVAQKRHIEDHSWPIVAHYSLIQSTNGHMGVLVDYTWH